MTAYDVIMWCAAILGVVITSWVTLSFIAVIFVAVERARRL
jgi:hypothetical protein